MSGSLDHHLDVVLPGLLRQVPEHAQLGELGLVGGVGEAAGAQRVAQREADVVLLEDLAELVEVREPGVLPAGGEHPLRHEGAAPADDAGDPVLRQRQEVAQDAGVDGHVIDALLRLLLDDVEQVLRHEALDALHALDGLVDGDGAERNAAGAEQLVADVGDDAAGGEIHHGIGAVLQAAMQLVQLGPRVAVDLAVADVRVDLARRVDADAHRLHLGVIQVRRDDHPPASHLGPDELGGKLLPARDVLHLLRHDALAGEVHLRNVGKAATPLDPFCAHDGPPRERTVNPAPLSVNTDEQVNRSSYLAAAPLAAPGALFSSPTIRRAP